MRITAMTVQVVNIPLTTTWQTSFDRRTGTTRTVVRLETDTGLVGWGETFRGSPTAALIERYRDILIGWNPYELEKLRTRLRMTPFFYGYLGYAAVAGIEMACLDLIGKDTGRSLTELLGGRVRDQVRVSGMVTPGMLPAGTGPASPQALAGAAAELRDQYGFDVLKLKGSSNARKDVALVAAMRERLPDIGLRLDPNAAWSVADSVWAARQLLPLDLEYLEDPCAGMEGMARVRQAVGIPLCTNMCVVRLEDFAPAIRTGAIDVIHGDVHKWGGVGAVRRLAALCDAFGIGMNLHSGGELGISTACHLQLTAATAEIGYAVDSVYYLLADDVIEEPFAVKDGMLPVPTGPGLGVTVDTEKLERYSRLHAIEGDLVW
ncbi:glucarate dehydratase [Micromonospora rhizosphaerae]|uniref:glucarate dehydratase n=1 Tax=Micromonospora rhizosphaerae TaxID=568872 RepID=A0A1C6T319_9ACTN|nr:enolase C-terminal domain-like protein [Micromonospora rhizosphaerae]SCL36206.1 glucarate dehydratase [Micromonospora rhizosphaerae]